MGNETPHLIGAGVSLAFFKFAQDLSKAPQRAREKQSRRRVQSKRLKLQRLKADLNLYYDVRHTGWHKRPDWFMVLDVECATQQEDLRRSYVVWQEGVNPFLVVELLSPGTETDVLGQTLREINRPPTKWQVYEQLLHIPYYAVFDLYENHFRLFQIVGNRYQ